jgi:hypothetical protein
MRRNGISGRIVAVAGGYMPCMSTIADPGSGRAAAPPDADSPAPAIIYLAAGVALVTCLVGLLLSQGEFSVATVAAALLATVPCLLYARLALARPGAEALVAGVLLVTVGAWGSIVALDGGDLAEFVRLYVSLVAVELAVFGIGAGLRALVPPRAPLR